ncbi:hypothetical protein [Tropicibacter oceani]|uniref:DUF4157 domain-containing protein n=1 Tax=Tropicibacter oceani TaxID=3058420 RepID=A0ABY8QLS1_9RHOB|nr:hypothetical protein [Tropicibacter oceani]WGW05485.1 hypothetical protein QF118_08035 [Tropicibacter oceani]
MPRFPWRPLRRGLAALVVLSLAAACALPGPQHALAPGLNGLQRIAPGVYSDAPGSAEAQRMALAEARARIEPFHGDVMPGRMILCTAQPCADRMRIGVLGLAYGDRLVIIGPAGITPAVIGHELAHVGLHRRVGLSGRLQSRMPRWFDEGLAVWLSPDPRYLRPDLARDAEWITQARSLRDWKSVVTKDSWPAVYGAAGRMVEAIAGEIGAEGLHRLIEATAKGADFDATLARLRADA